MSKIQEILRLKYAVGLSHERIARVVELSKGAVCKYVSLAEAAGLTEWPLPDGLDEAALEQRLRPRREPTASRYVDPDWFVVHQELKKKGVTLQRLWSEHVERVGDQAHRYSQFSLRYKRWRARQRLSMRQVHRAGEKLFIDYCGPTVPVIDRRTGEVRGAQIFVAVMGASSYTYAEATWSQSLPDWIGANRRALEFLGGVPALLVPDNLKAAVVVADRYEPRLNDTYAEFARHYGTAILPARPRRPKDKAKAEAAVLLVERWILAALRHREFFNLGELNRAIVELLAPLNARPFQRRTESRRDLFDALDRPALRPLPATPYDYAEWRHATVSIDYHVDVDRRYYSVPYRHVGERVAVRTSATTVEVLLRGRRIALHARDDAKRFHTDRNHMPAAHRAHAEWSPRRFLTWAASIGTATLVIVRHQLENRPHPEHGYRSCLGLLDLSRRYDRARLEAACQRALELETTDVKSVRSILACGLDRETPDDIGPDITLPEHENVRGADYYH